MAQRDLIPLDDDAADLLDRVDERHVPDGKWPTMLAEFIDVLRDTFVRRGMSAEDADQLARAGVLALSEYLGGRYFYLSRGDRVRAALRDDEVWREFNGRNIAELAARHGLTERQVYRAIAEQRAMRVKRRQGQLFPTSDSGKISG